MEEFLIEAFDTFCKEIETEAALCPYELWNESVFRFFFLRTLRRQYPQLVPQVEWRKIDLLLSHGVQHALVEIKYYQAVAPKGLDSIPMKLKGGAGKQNFEEFRQCVKKLESLSSMPWYPSSGPESIHRFLLLGYVVPPTPIARRRDYARFYDPLLRGEAAAEYSKSLDCMCSRSHTVPDSTDHRLTLGLFRIT